MGETNFVFTADTVQSASANYAAAKKEFEAAKSALETALKGVNWDDPAAAAWKTEVDEAMKQLNLMETKLGENEILLNKMAAASGTAQENIKGGINSIY